MEIRRSNIWVWGLLLGAWVAIIVWQVVEHARVVEAARDELRKNAKVISYTVSVVLRSQRRFGVISRDRVEPALAGVLQNFQPDLSALALLNAAAQIVVQSPTNVDLRDRAAAHSPELWEGQFVAIFNPVDLGTNVMRDLENVDQTIIVMRDDFARPGETNRPAGEFRGPPGPEMRGPLGDTNNLMPFSMEAGDPRRRDGPDVDRRGRGGYRYGRPPWMSEAEYKSMTDKQGVHSFLAVLSTQSVIDATRRDTLVRCLVVVLASLAMGALGVAWRNTLKTAELQIRLVRASEMNSHLKELNLAAAGLAHETRNPLNIIRGLAQMISKRNDAVPEVRERSMEIVTEADRVAGQLNEFINYSRPREVRRARVVVKRVADEVVRALSFDAEEKQLLLHVSGDPLVVDADEQLLRQALFNLALNAVQAANPKGEIEIRMVRHSVASASLEVNDDGPGVPAAERKEIFKPYFTTTQKGTGLGLAVVQQIVLAHGWDVECLANEPRGARFRISHLKPVA